MTDKQIRNRKRYISLAVAALLVIGGVVAIGVGLASQKQPPAATVSSHTPSAISPMSSDETPKKSSGPALAYSRPETLKIPALKTDSEIIELGKQPNGEVEVPAGDHIDQPGWYKYSPTPGQHGASVILGHVDDFEGPSLFWELAKLTPGEKIEVKRADGIIAEFSVSKVESYLKDKFPTQAVYTSSGDAELRLVTCGGFDKSSHDYENNTVVFARLVSSHR